LKQADFYLFKITAWIAAFYACANFAAMLESVSRYGAGLTPEQILFTGAERSLAINTSVNILAEPFYVYITLGLMLFSGVMFAKEILGFQKYLSSLVHGEAITRTGVSV